MRDDDAVQVMNPAQPFHLAVTGPVVAHDVAEREAAARI